MRTLRSSANGCRVTDHNPQEGPSFRTGLHGSPLILVVQFAGVHGNKGIIINKGFKFSRSEGPLRGTSLGPDGRGRGPCSLHLLQQPGLMPDGRAWEAVPSPGLGPGGRGGQEGTVKAVSAAGKSHVARGELRSFTRGWQRGRHPQVLPAHSRGDPLSAHYYLKPGIGVGMTEFPSSLGRLAP